jgi:preprotein translocase subunit YajC
MAPERITHMVEAIVGFIAGLIVMDAAWYWMLRRRMQQEQERQEQEWKREWEWHQRGWSEE